MSDILPFSQIHAAVHGSRSDIFRRLVGLLQFSWRHVQVSVSARDTGVQKNMHKHRGASGVAAMDALPEVQKSSVLMVQGFRASISGLGDSLVGFVLT